MKFKYEQLSLNSIYLARIKHEMRSDIFQYSEYV